MSDPGFLYRRLARFIPCALPHVCGGRLLLRDKFQVASASEVFLNPFYWRLFDCLALTGQRPEVVVDLGAHCGHFVLLCEQVIRSIGGETLPHYWLLEPMPDMVERCRQSLADAGLAERSTVIAGLVGKRDGVGLIKRQKHNALTAGLYLDGPVPQTLEIAYQDLEKLIPAQPIDVLKIDIEGSEYELVENYVGLFQRTRLCFLELHPRPGRNFEEVTCRLQAAGLQLRPPVLQNGSCQLLTYLRS